MLSGCPFYLQVTTRARSKSLKSADHNASVAPSLDGALPARSSRDAVGLEKKRNEASRTGMSSPSQDVEC